MSHTPRWLLALTLIAGFSLAAYAMTGDQPPPDAHCVEVSELGVFVCGTTTTVAEPTTTSITATTSSTTTTTQATTTTTVDTGLVIPETIPYPGGLKDGGGFNFMIACIDTTDVTCELNDAGKKEIAEFDYFGHGMPYLYPEATEGMHQHGWWEHGDREGYRCAYGFLYDQHPNPFGSLSQPRPAEFIARATIVRVGGYGKVNDRYMNEGTRYYDGSLAFPDGNEIPDEDCVTVAKEPGFDYNSYVPHGPDEIRVGLFRSDGAISDVRDFTKIDIRVPGHFEFVSFDGQRVQIVFVLGVTNKPAFAFYYDVLGSGRIAVEVNGATIGES